MDKCEFGMTLVYTNVLDIEFKINNVESLINDLSTNARTEGVGNGSEIDNFPLCYALKMSLRR